MDPADNPLTGCDQDIELNASRPGYGKHQANAMISSSHIYEDEQKTFYLRATKPKMKVRIAMPNDWLKIPTLTRANHDWVEHQLCWLPK